MRHDLKTYRDYCKSVMTYHLASDKNRVSGLPLKHLLQLPINHTVAWARLVTFVYLKFAQILILKVVSNNSIYGLQCYSFKVSISPCYGWDMSNGIWGLFWVIFGHAHLRPPYVEHYEASVLWHQNKATQSVIKLSNIILWQKQASCG